MQLRSRSMLVWVSGQCKAEATSHGRGDWIADDEELAH
jgi:hypothetical protein